MSGRRIVVSKRSILMGRILNGLANGTRDHRTENARWWNKSELGYQIGGWVIGRIEFLEDL